MDGLRWLLLLFGLLVIAGVYLYSRREKNKPADEIVEASSERLEPTMGGADSEPPGEDAEPRVELPTIGDDEPSEPIAEGVAQKIVTLRLIGR